VLPCYADRYLFELSKSSLEGIMLIGSEWHTLNESIQQSYCEIFQLPLMCNA